MIVRSLKKYINFLTGGVPISTIGALDDPLLTKLAGETDIGSYLATLTKFATKSHIQVWYEFLQNADDARADQVFFYFDEGHFVVINNGTPFYTDEPKFKKEESRKGQLRDFLSRQKGDKFRDPELIGKYGQGSKLLYDLLLPGDSDSKIEDDLVEFVLNKHIGPILFSWKNLSDLERLINWGGDTIDYSGNCQDDTFPLLTKLIYSFYPAALGETSKTLISANVALFPTEELDRCVKFLREIRFFYSTLGFSQGTLLYIPLGEGQHLRLKEEFESSLLPGIQTSLGFLKNLKTVQVLDKEVGKSGLRSVDLPEIQIGEKSYSLKLAFAANPQSLDYDLVNFYQFFPIADTSYGLNMVINTEAYEIGSDRQRIEFSKPHNQKVLEAISTGISELICRLRKQNDREQLIELIHCVFSTNVAKTQREPLIQRYLYDEIISTIRLNLPTANGFADGPEFSRIKETKLTVNPLDLGFDEWGWIDGKLQPVYAYLSKSPIGVETYTIVDLIKKCPDQEKLKKWILELPQNEYHLLLSEVQEHTSSYKEIQQLPFLRFSNDEIYTPEEVALDESLILLLPGTQDLQPILERLSVISSGKEVSEFKELSKLLSQNTKFNGEAYFSRIAAAVTNKNLDWNEKWAVFKVFSANDTAKRLLQEELCVFENQDGQKRPLDHLIKNTSEVAPSGILRLYSLKATENNFNELDNWLLQPAQIWDQLIHDWKDLGQPLTTPRLFSIVS